MDSPPSLCKEAPLAERLRECANGERHARNAQRASSSSSDLPNRRALTFAVVALDSHKRHADGTTRNSRLSRDLFDLCVATDMNSSHVQCGHDRAVTGSDHLLHGCDKRWRDGASDRRWNGRRHAWRSRDRGRRRNDLNARNPRIDQMQVPFPTSMVKMRRCPREGERHQDRVHHLAGPLVVTLPEALALEAELLVQLDRGLVPREHVQLKLAHA